MTMVTLLTVALVATTLAPTVGAQAAARSADTHVAQGVLAAEDAYVAAEVSRDEPALRRIVDDDFVYNSADGSTSGKEGLIQSVLSMDMVDQQISERSVFLEGDVAIIYGTAALSLRGEDHEIQVHRYRYTSIYVNRKGQWKMRGLQMQPHSDR